ncbi:MAG TPA: flagellar filament capping protein FliD [Acidimicrobiia bacterium]|nr:flagellar filament capping protein FliD [Acidimicrobiia bacterium]
MANSSIDGLVSGLDTTTIINQLMSLERQPQNRLKTQKTTISSEIAIYQTLNTKFSALAAKAQELARPAGWAAMKATSSSEAVTATATSTASAGQLSFTVQQLARAGAVASTGTVASTAAIVATGPVSVQVGTATVQVDPGSGSLAALVDAINASGAGISAAAVKVGTAGYRLQVSSTSTGAASDVLVDTTNLDGSLGSFATVQAGRDAVIRVGEGAGAYDVTSATDSINDLLPGVSVKLQQADPTTTVTIMIARDSAAIADEVAALVDAANAALSTIAANSTYDTETKKAGLLLADGNARRLADQVYSAISSLVAGNSLGSAGGVGISLVKDGTVAFDRNKFLAAYAADPAGVARLFQEGGTATDSHVAYLAGSDNTRAGTYAVAITQAAAQASKTGTALSGAGLLGAETIDVRVGGASGVTVSYAAQAGETLASVADGLNAAFAQQSLALSASVQSGQLVLQTSAYGSLASFEVRSSALGAAGEQTGLVAAPGVWESHAGADVAGTINGVNATGQGQALMAPALDPTLGGLALTITATTPGDLGTFTYIPGIAARLDAAASDAIDFGTGSITTAISGRQTRISQLDDQISNWDVRLAAREATMRAQFAAMETALGKLRDQSNWLAGQLASLPTSSSSDK